MPFVIGPLIKLGLIVLVPEKASAPPLMDIQSFTPPPTVGVFARSILSVPPLSVNPPPSVKVPGPLLPGESFPPALRLTRPPIEPVPVRVPLAVAVVALAASAPFTTSVPLEMVVPPVW